MRTVITPSQTVHIDLGERSYPIVIASDLLGAAETFAACPAAAQAVIVTNTTVQPLYAAQLQAALASKYPQVHMVVLPEGTWRDVLTGTRLSADDKFIRALLDGHPNTSLIVCLKVRRKPPKDETGNDDYSFYNYPYNRYYLIGQDGITRSL